MDLDVCIDDAGNAYLGHSSEYHAKSGEAFFQSLSFCDVHRANSAFDHRRHD